jgi:hypothetical protein
MIELSLIDWEMIAAAAAVAAAGTAAMALMSEGRRSRRHDEIRLLQEFSREFESAQMAHFRVRACSAKLADPAQQDTSALGVIFDFFETIAFYTREGVVSLRYVWKLFFYYLVGYRAAFAAHFEAMRTADPFTWADAEWLSASSIAFNEAQGPAERSKFLARGATIASAPADRIAAFLQMESQLDLRRLPLQSGGVS